MGAVNRLAKVEAVAIAEEVASSLRHDLRNKFAAIRNAVFYIERSLTKTQAIDQDPRVARFLLLVCEQLDAADALLDQRGIHGAARGPTEAISLDGRVRDSLSRRETPEGVRLITNLTGPSLVDGIAEEVELVLDCLIDNAIEAVGETGDVTVETEENSEAVRVRVKDTGPGVTREQFERVRLPFASDKPGHVGLGLNIATRIAGRMGGQLDLESEVGAPGSAWVLTFPKVR